MPIYVYCCQEHGEFEKLKREPIAEDICPNCGLVSPRIFSAPTGLPPFKSYWIEMFPHPQNKPLPIEVQTREQERALSREYGLARVK
jgi:putative FmdB family regulatory protein